MKRILSKIPYLIVLAAILASAYFLSMRISTQATWANKKAIYNDLIELVGKIAANTESTSELRPLKRDFDNFFSGSMIHGEEGSKQLLARMMLLEKDFRYHLLDKRDVNAPDRLKKSCQKLIKQLSKTIADGDLRYLREMLISVIAGMLGLLAYFLFKNPLKKRNFSNHPKKLVSEIKLLVGQGNTNEALDRMVSALDESKSDKLDEVLLIQANYKDIIRKRNMGVVDSNEENLGIARANKAILDFLNN